MSRWSGTYSGTKPGEAMAPPVALPGSSAGKGRLAAGAALVALTEPVEPPEPLRAELDTAADHDLGWSLSMLTQAVTVLSESLLGWDGHEVEVCELLGHVRTQRMLLAKTESLLETSAAQLMAGDQLEWPGGRAERRWGKDRKEWDNEGLISAVAAQIAVSLAVDPVSGELDTDTSTTAHEAIAAYALTNRPAWRVTALKPLGLFADDFCSSSPARPSVQVVLADPS